MPFQNWALELVAAIAGEWHWSREEIMSTPAGAAFHYAMICKRQRYQRLDDHRQAVAYVKFDRRTREAMLSKISLMTSGPGLHVAWESLLNEKERSAAAEANRERDEVYEKLKAAGVLVKVDGTLPIDKMLKKRGS